VKAGRDDADCATIGHREGDLALGVDIGGTLVKTGLVDTPGHVVARHDIDAQPEQPFESQLARGVARFTIRYVLRGVARPLCG